MRIAHLVLLAEVVLFGSFAVPMLTGCGSWTDDDDEDYEDDYGASGSYTPPAATANPAPSCPSALYVTMGAPPTGDCKLSIAVSDSSYGSDGSPVISYFFPAPTSGTGACTPIGSAPALQQCHRDSLGVFISTTGTYDLAAVRQVLGPSIDTSGVTLVLDCAAAADTTTQNELLVCASSEPSPPATDDAGTSTDTDAGASNADGGIQADANADGGAAQGEGGAPQADAGCGP